MASRRSAAPSVVPRKAKASPGRALPSRPESTEQERQAPENVALEEPGPFVPGFACQAQATVRSYGNSGLRQIQTWSTLLWAADEDGLYERMAAYRIALAEGNVDDAPRPGVRPAGGIPAEGDPAWPVARDGQVCTVVFGDILEVARRLPSSEGRIARTTVWQRHRQRETSPPRPPSASRSGKQA